MADTKREEEQFDLSAVDTEHLARQALQLFRKRYSALYDNLMVFDTKGVGYVTYEEFHKIVSDLEDAKIGSEENIQLTWFCATGGHTGEEVAQFDRSQLIDLCIRGYHSRDENHIKLLVDAVTNTNRTSFDSMDTNQDGFISHEEFAAWVDKIGDKEKWQVEELTEQSRELVAKFPMTNIKRAVHAQTRESTVKFLRPEQPIPIGFVEAFPAMDLNGDGMIDREEFLKCGLGFFFHTDEERYNHFFGVIKH